MSGIEIDHDFIRDCIVDVAAGRGIGVNGLNVTGCDVRGHEISLAVNSPFSWPRQPVVTCVGADESSTYSLVVNGAVVGKFSGSALKAGVAIPVSPRG
jgi:hypothetical protein